MIPTPSPETPDKERSPRGLAATATVAVADNVFRPMELTVSIGTRVVWTNVGQNPHTVTANDRAFDSGTLEGGQTLAVTFDEVGRVPYYCQIHGEPGSGMFGAVIVQPAQGGRQEGPPAGGTDDLAATGFDATPLALLAGLLAMGLLSLRAGRPRSREGGDATTAERSTEHAMRNFIGEG